MSFIIAATGHRPKSLPTGYNLEPLIALAKPWLAAKNPDAVLSGMALGWDWAVAYAAMDLGIPVHAMIPFIGQSDKWSTDQNYEYTRLLQKCATKTVVNQGGYDAWKMQARNEAMVDACDMVLALWNGGPGGTANCVEYANSLFVPVENLWDVYDMEI